MENPTPENETAPVLPLNQDDRQIQYGVVIPKKTGILRFSGLTAADAARAAAEQHLQVKPSFEMVEVIDESGRIRHFSVSVDITIHVQE